MEAIKVVSYVHGNLVSMEETLLYFQRGIKNQQIQPSDVENFRKLMREMKHTIDAFPLFEKRMRKVHRQLGDMVSKRLDIGRGWE